MDAPLLERARALRDAASNALMARGSEMVGLECDPNAFPTLLKETEAMTELLMDIDNALAVLKRIGGAIS